MILVDYDGNAIGGNFSLPANAAGFLIHSAVHKARPDVTAACHTHSPYGKAWSAFAKPLEMLNQDVTYLYGDAQAVYEVSLHWPMKSSNDTDNSGRNSTASSSQKKKVNASPKPSDQKAKV